MSLGDYAIQVSRFIPKAYWKVAASSSETAIFGSGSLSLANCSVVFRPLIFTSQISGTTPNLIGGVILNASNSTVTTPTLDNYKIASSSYSMNKFTITFWYQNLNNVTSSTAIATIGSNINIYATDGKILLNFLGQYSYVKVEDFRDLMQITIIYDGTTSKLVVNGVEGISEGVFTLSFESAPTLKFQNTSTTVYQVSDLAIYAYNLSPSNLQLLYGIATTTGQDFEQISNSLGDTLFNSTMSEVDKVFDIYPDNVELRNCIYTNDKFELSPKPLAVVSGASFSSGNGGYGFSSSASYISFKPGKNDIDYANTRISVTVAALTSGTIISLITDNGSGIYVKYESGKYNLYINASVATSITTTNTTFSIDFVNNTIYLTVGGTSQSAGQMLNSQISSVYIGNNNNPSDRYTGYISNVSVNYKDFPLQTGKYVLDLSVDSGTSYIKAKQDGVANFTSYVPSGSLNNYVTYKSNSSKTSLRYYSGTSEVSLSDYKKAANGTAISNGNSIYATNPTSPTIAKFAIRLTDDNAGSSNVASMIMPSLSALKFFGYSSNSVTSDRVATILSTSENSIRPRETDLNSSLKYNFGISSNNSSTALTVDSLGSYTSSPVSVYFNLRVDSIPSTGTLFSIGSVNITLTNNTSSYALAASSGTLYIDGGNSASTLKPFVTYSVILTISSLTFSTASFAKLVGCQVFNFGISPSVLTASQISRISQCLFNNNTITNSDTGSTLTVTDTGTAKSFTSNIILSG